MNIAIGPHGAGAAAGGMGIGGNMAMHPHYGYQGMPMGRGGGHPPFPTPGMGALGGPPFMPPGPPVNPTSGPAAHHVPPGSGSVLLVSNLNAEVRRFADSTRNL